MHPKYKPESDKWDPENEIYLLIGRYPDSEVVRRVVEMGMGEQRAIEWIKNYRAEKRKRGRIAAFSVIATGVVFSSVTVVSIITSYNSQTGMIKFHPFIAVIGAVTLIVGLLQLIFGLSAD